MAKTKTAAGPKKRNDAYTMMLFVTLVALGIGCTLMYLDWDEYGQKSPNKETVPPLPKLGTIPTAPPPTPPTPAEPKPEEPKPEVPKPEGTGLRDGPGRPELHPHRRRT